MSQAQAAAKWRSADEVWLDHASLDEVDLEWLRPVKRLVLWSVRLSEGLQARLPSLVSLELRGGSGTTAISAAGCSNLRFLAINQVRRLPDLDVLSTLISLEFLSLYGLPRVRSLPSMAPMHRLVRIELGSMKGLTGLTGLLDAPALEELLLIRTVAVAASDAKDLADNTTLREFDWFGEDVPVRVWAPFMEAVGRPKSRVLEQAEWFEQRAGR